MTCGKSIETIKSLQLNVQELSCHVPITQKQLNDMYMQIRTLTQKAEKADYSFHQMAKLEVIKIENAFVKVELFMYQ
jgi:hypothetical protein